MSDMAIETTREMVDDELADSVEVEFGDVATADDVLADDEPTDG